MALVEEQVDNRPIAEIPEEYKGLDPVLEQQLTSMVAEMEDAKDAIRAAQKLARYALTRPGATEETYAAERRATKKEIEWQQEKISALTLRITKQLNRLDAIRKGPHGQAVKEVKGADAQAQQAGKELSAAEAKLGAGATALEIDQVAQLRARRDTLKNLADRLRASLPGAREKGRRTEAAAALDKLTGEVPSLTKTIKDKAIKYVAAVNAAREQGEDLQRTFDAFRDKCEASGVDMPGSLFLQLDSPLKWAALLVTRDWSEPTRAMFGKELAWVTEATDELQKIVKSRIERARVALAKEPEGRSPILIDREGHAHGLQWQVPEEENPGDPSKLAIPPIHPAASRIPGRQDVDLTRISHTRAHVSVE